MQSTVDKLIKKTNLALVVGSSSWREQFVNAVTVSAGNTHTNNTTNSHTHTTLIAFGIVFFFIVYCNYKSTMETVAAGACLTEWPAHRNGGFVSDK